MRVNQLALSQAVLLSLAKVGIHEVEQLAEHRIGELLRRPEFSSGVELYELICELHRHGLTPFSGHGGHIQTARERGMFRLRAVDGLTLDEIGERFAIKRERVRQLLHLHFQLDGVPPAAKVRRARSRLQSDPLLQAMRPHTFRERRRLYVLAHVVIMCHYGTSLTIESVAKLLASSPRQLQRAFAQFGESTFREDLRARRMAAAAELLSEPAIQVCEVARQVGYHQHARSAATVVARLGHQSAALPITSRVRRRCATSSSPRPRRRLLADTSGPVVAGRRPRHVPPRQMDLWRGPRRSYPWRRPIASISELGEGTKTARMPERVKQKASSQA